MWIFFSAKYKVLFSYCQSGLNRQLALQPHQLQTEWQNDTMSSIFKPYYLFWQMSSNINGHFSNKCINYIKSISYLRVNVSNNSSSGSPESEIT